MREKKIQIAHNLTTQILHCYQVGESVLTNENARPTTITTTTTGVIALFYVMLSTFLNSFQNFYS